MRQTRVALRCVSWALLAAAGPLAAQAGVPVGAEFRVNTFTTGFQDRSSVVSDSSGNFVVLWQSLAQDGSSYGIVGQRYASSGAALGAEFLVNSFTTDNQRYPSVTSDPSGNFVVVWSSNTQDGSNFGTFGQRYASSGAPAGAEFRINTFTTNYQGGARAAADSSGNFVVVWESLTQDGSSYGVFGQRYASSGAPVGAEFLVNTYTTSQQRIASVASDSSGSFVVVWQSLIQDGSIWGVFGQRFASSGAPAGTEFKVNTYTTDNQLEPSVASDASGNFVVIWVGQDGSSYGIVGQRYASSGAALGAEFLVNSVTTDNQRYPRVACDSSGNFVVVWSSNTQDGSNLGVFGQRYSSSGTPAGPEFRVNTYTTDQQGLPRVASDPAGNFVVVWQSVTQDGSNFGVFGQRYGKIVPVELIRFTAE
jgi:hypothetical protein